VLVTVAHCNCAVETFIRGLHMLRTEISRQKLGTNGNVEYKILNFKGFKITGLLNLHGTNQTS
jgi:hypothetical protein